MLVTVVTFGGCNTDSSDSESDLEGSWTVTSWVQDGVAQPEAVSSGLIIVFTNETMTISNTTGESFIYSGSYTMDEVDHIEATLNETTGNSEINQYEFSVDAGISSSTLTLDGDMIARSPFWPDNNSTISIAATR